MNKTKRKSGGAGRIIALLAAVVIIVGGVLAAYCASVDGVWAKNPNPLTWQWGGITTTQEESEPHTHAAAAHTARCYAVSPQSDDGISLTAINPGFGGGGTVCPNCGTGFLETFTNIQPTCTQIGQSTTRCNQNCGYITNSNIAKLGHSYRWVVASSTTEEYKCSRCDDVSNTRDHTHNFAWVQTVAPTQTTEGEEQYKCNACGTITETRVLPSLREPVELPEDPTREGYTFTGWYFDEACTQPYDGSPIYEDTALYAGWQINTFTVTLDSAGGNELAALTVDWNTAAQLPTPSRLGHVFLGWYLSDGTQYEAQPITDDLTLTAHWERSKCTVNFYVDGALYTSLTVDYGTPLIQAVESAGLFEQNVISYSFLNGDNPAGEISELKVTGDISIMANEPTGGEKVKGAINNYWLPAAFVGVGVVALALLGYAIFGGKRKR